jgi:ketosteroid isomerase-like protein
MNANNDLLTVNKKIVRAFYEGGVRGDITGFANFLHPDFVLDAPGYLPWGGHYRGSHNYLEIVLPAVAEALDFSRFSFESITAEDDRVVALINVGVKGSEDAIKISEHWLLGDGKALSLWVAYYEPQSLLEQLKINRSENKISDSKKEAIR